MLKGVADRDPAQVRCAREAAAVVHRLHHACCEHILQVLPPQEEFLAAVKEVGSSLQPVFEQRPEVRSRGAAGGVWRAI